MIWVVLIAASLLVVMGLVWWLRKRERVAPKEVKLAQTFHKLLDGGGDEAVGDLRELYQRSDHDVGIGLALGIVLRQRGDLRAAIRLHQSLIGRPGLDQAVLAYLYAELAADYLASGLLARASEALNQARQTGFLDDWICQKGVSIYSKMQQWEQATTLLKTYAKQSGHSQAEGIAWVCVEAGEAALREEQYAVARKAYEEALSVRKDWLPGHLGVSSCLRLLKRPEKAQKYLEKNRAAFGDSMWLWVDEMGRVATQLGSTESFLDSLTASLGEDPSDWRSRRAAAQIAIEVGRHELAFLWLRECVQLAPTVLLVHQTFWRLIRRSEQAADIMTEYMQFVREKMSFGRPYHCDVCEYQSETVVWRCPSCNRLATITEKRI